MEQYYIKNGRKYVAVEQFTGFPADGVWVVKDCGHASQLIMKLNHKPISSSAIANLAATKYDLKEIILPVLRDQRTETVDELVQKISDALLKCI